MKLNNNAMFEQCTNPANDMYRVLVELDNCDRVQMKVRGKKEAYELGRTIAMCGCPDEHDGIVSFYPVRRIMRVDVIPTGEVIVE